MKLRTILIKVNIKKNEDSVILIEKLGTIENNYNDKITGKKVKWDEHIDVIIEKSSIDYP